MPLSEDIRRVVTFVDETDKAVVLFDGANPHKRKRPQRGTVSRLIWSTGETPAIINEPVDRSQVEIGISPPRGGSVFRIVDMPPITPDVEALPNDYHSSQHGDGAPRRHLPARHPLMHATRTIDYAIVMEGEVTMLLDDSEVKLKAGDVLVQQGTNHAWVNRGPDHCRIAFVLIDAQEP